MNHVERRAHFNGLRYSKIGNCGIGCLPRALIKAMTDPHPGVSRVATSVLARLAEPSDTLAEDALKRAAQSADESTRRYGEQGLARLERDRKLALKPKLEGSAREDG